MKFLFKKSTTEQHPVGNRFSSAIKQFLAKLQSGWANWMTKRTEGFSSATWKVLVVLFVVAGTAGFALIISNSLMENKKQMIGFNRLKKPQNAMGNKKSNLLKPLSSGIEFRRIRRFRAYMDSLVKTPAGKEKYDSIMASYPGLLDSARHIEESNQLQINEKLWKRKK